jgi:hypothetical protein
MLAYLNDGSEIWNAYPGFWGSFSLVGEGTVPDDAAEQAVSVSHAAASAPRRSAALASAELATMASATPWPIAERDNSEPIPSALAYAAQPTSIATARSVPLPFGVPRATPAAR